MLCLHLDRMLLSVYYALRACECPIVVRFHRRTLWYNDIKNSWPLTQKIFVWWLCLFNRHETRHRPSSSFSLFALRKMASQESQHPEQETEDDDGLAAGPLLVTKLQVRSSSLDALFFEIDAFSCSIVLMLPLLSPGIWY